MGTPSILVVEDDRIFNQVLVTSLEHKGYIVESAGCGEEALEKIEKMQFQVVITDFRLGRVNGYTVIRGCKKKDPKTVAIMITGVDSQEVEKEALACGADAFFFKPISVAALLEHLPTASSDLDI